MSFRTRVEDDPWSTSLERCLAYQFDELWQARDAETAVARRRLGPKLWAEVCQYWAAMNENTLWNSAVHHAWQRTVHWDPDQASWRNETDEEYAARTAKLRWRPMRDGRFEFLG